MLNYRNIYSHNLTHFLILRDFILESPALSKAKPTRKSKLTVKPTQITKGSRISRVIDKISKPLK